MIQTPVFASATICACLLTACAGQPTVHVASKAIKANGTPHDFDFALGTWHTQLRRRLHPLTGSTTWVEYDGSSVVRPVWDGRANLVELDVHGPAGRIVGLSVRLFDPEARTWSLNFANPAGGGACRIHACGEGSNVRCPIAAIPAVCRLSALKEGFGRPGVSVSAFPAMTARP